MIVVSGSWPTPVKLEALPAVESFSDELLLTSFRRLVCDVAERMQVPMDYPAAIVVLCLAGSVNRRVRIQPKANDTTWVVVPNLWGAIVAPPGDLKSPVIQAMTQPLLNLESEWLADYEKKLETYQRVREESELRMAAWREHLRSRPKTEALPLEGRWRNWRNRPAPA